MVTPETVLVIVGEWECSSEGIWNFLLEKDVMAQSVVLTPNMNYKELRAVIEHEFEVSGKGVEANISFWMPNQMSIFFSGSAPPVCIKSDSGLTTFRQVRAENRWLNMFVSFSSCAPLEQNVHGVAGSETSGADKDVNSPTGFLTFDGRGGQETYGKQGNEPRKLNWEDGIIRLGDATPSDTEANDHNPVPENLHPGHDPTNNKNEAMQGGTSGTQKTGVEKDPKLPTGFLTFHSPGSKDTDGKLEKGTSKLNWDDGISSHGDTTPSDEEGIEPTAVPQILHPGDATTNKKEAGIILRLRDETSSERSNNGSQTDSSMLSCKNNSHTQKHKQAHIEVSSDNSEEDDCVELQSLSPLNGDTEDAVHDGSEKASSEESEESTEVESEEESEEEYDPDFWQRVCAEHEREMQNLRPPQFHGANARVSGDAVVPDLNKDSNEDDDAVVPEYIAPHIDRDTIQLFDVAEGGTPLGDTDPSTFCEGQTSAPPINSSKQPETGASEAVQDISIVGEQQNSRDRAEDVLNFHKHGKSVEGSNTFSTAEAETSFPVNNNIAFEKGQSSEAIVENHAVNADDIDAHALQSSLANIYAEVREANLLPLEDAPAVIEYDEESTGEQASLEFDENNDEIVIGRIFKDKEEMEHVLSLNAIRNLYNFKNDKSDKTRLIVRCVDRSCKWRVFGAVMGGNSGNIQIRTARLEHTCDVSTRAQYGKKASAKVVANVIKQKYANGQKGPRPVEIPGIVLAELKVSITYMKAWYAKEKAVASVRGSEEANYNLLLRYLKLLRKANPGTFYNVQTTITSKGQTRFQYLFFALGPSIAAIPFLRKVIIIDGTTIKTKFKGTLLTASYQDGNFQIFPLGFGVVDGETQPAWTWFFKQLQEIVPDSTELMFVSDRHSSIYAAIEEVYPLAHHGACLVHLVRNVNARFKGRGLCGLVSRAGKAFTVGGFRYWFGEIEKRNPGCAAYLRAIGFEHWTQAYCRGMRYNLSSTNIAESLNAALKKALDLPIVSLVETIRMMLMQWFCWRRAKAANSKTVLTPEVEKLIMKHLSRSTSHEAIAASAWVYEVRSNKGVSYTVDLERSTCTCRVFDKLLIPCSHALAGARAAGIPFTGMANWIYKGPAWDRVYAGVVMPVPNMEDEEVQHEQPPEPIIPPKAKRGPGRQRKRRIPSSGDPAPKRRNKGENKCSRCHGTGHNKTTCNEPLN